MKKRLAEILAVAVVYAGLGQISFSMAIAPGNVSAIWPASGVALTAVLLLGYGIWPGILLGSFLVNVWFFMRLAPFSYAAAATAFGIAAGSVLQALAGGWMIRRFVGTVNPFDRARDVFKFVGLEALSCLLAASFGVASLFLAGLIGPDRYGATWGTWWLGDFVGVITVTPLLLASTRPWKHRNFLSLAEFALFLGLLFAVCQTVFTHDLSYSGAYAFIPFMMWAAFRFGQSGVPAAILILSAVAIWRVQQIQDPVMAESLVSLFPFLQACMGIVTITGIVLAATVNERRRAQAELLRSRKELSDFVEKTSMPLHWVGPDGRILWANQAELDLLGYAREEVVGHPIAEFHADQATLKDISRRLENHEPLRDYEAVLRCKDGSFKTVLISSNVFGQDAEFVHTRCFTRDITERKHWEAELEAANRRLQENLKKLQFMNKLMMGREERIIDLKKQVKTFEQRGEHAKTDA